MDDPDYNDPRRGALGDDEPAGPGPESDVEDEEDLGIFGEDGAMNPDHPLMKRAQDALKAQLEESRQKLVEQLREKSEELKVSGRDRAHKWHRFAVIRLTRLCMPRVRSWSAPAYPAHGNPARRCSQHRTRNALVLHEEGAIYDTIARMQ